MTVSLLTLFVIGKLLQDVEILTLKILQFTLKEFFEAKADENFIDRLNRERHRCYRVMLRLLYLGI